ncbi:MAG: hypothetical protein HUK19_00485 [Fibrobacter sp.]|nr:hypothetical protein [Fibrobacter sp.]
MFQSLKKQTVEDFIKNHSASMRSDIISAVANFLPQISNYREEDKTFSFRIILGVGTLPSIKGRPHVLKTLPLKDLTAQMVTKTIRSLTIFCCNGADILINQTEDSVTFGVVYFDIEQTGLAEIYFLRKGFLIMGSISRTKVIVIAMGPDDKPENLILSFDFSGSENLPVPDFSKKYNRDVALWSGIFRRAKKDVHGTICLIVSPEWSWEKDCENFSRGDVLQNPVSIAYGDGTDSTRKLDDGVRMLLSMMDYDGMTIIDTHGNIRAYHCFVKIDQNDCSVGGSRHIAFATLKKKNNNLYKAIYFQSHEGQVEFTYMSGPNEGKSISVFDATVMNMEYDGSFMERFIAKARQRKVLRNHRKSERRNKLLRAIYVLFVAHYRIDNFYTEPEHVRTLNQILDDDIQRASLHESETLSMFLINTLLVCFVGNTYGYSTDSEVGIKEIFKKIDVDVWTTYFDRENHIEEKVMEALSDGEARKRWDVFKSEIEKIHPELKQLQSLQNVNARDFVYMYKAFLHLKDEG